MEQPKVKPKGKVYICGAGPGDRNLLTIKACKLLSECDVILYDRLVNKGILNMASSQSEKVRDADLNAARNIALRGAGKV